MVGLLVHRGLAHQDDDRVLVRHRAAHPRDAPEVLLEPLDPVRSVYHRLYLRRIVQVREVERNILIISQTPYGQISLAPLHAHLLPGLDPHVNRIVLVTSPKDFPHVIRQLFLVTMAHPCQQIALEVRRAALERRPGELLANYLVQSGQSVRNHQSDALNAPLMPVERADADTAIIDS